MTHRYNNPEYSAGPINASLTYEYASAIGRDRLFLMAVQSDILPPIFLGGTPLQRMRVILMAPEEAVTLGSLNDPTVGEIPQVVPPIPLPLPMPGVVTRHARQVRGEILSDEAGRLYEKVGYRIRPLNRVITGPCGEVLEPAPFAQSKSATRVPRHNEPVVEYEEATFEQQPTDPSEKKAFESSKDPYGFPLRAENRTASTAYRTLFPDPGIWRVLQLGDFKEMLVPQLAHPERLRETHRLPCYVQIYETRMSQRIDSLAAAALRDPSAAIQLHPLTDQMAIKLALTDLLRVQSHVPRHVPRKPGMLLPGDRAFRLQLASDPTTDSAGANRVQQQAKPSVVESPTITNAAGTGPAFDSPAQQNAIPERFLKPWEFRFSREDVIYDMQARATSSGWFISLSRKLKGWFRNRTEYQKWQVLLCGKSLEEQLWAVRPPKGGLSNPTIRDWAQKTLELAGYDPRTMLLEWEIHWRRKEL